MKQRMNRGLCCLLLLAVVFSGTGIPQAAYAKKVKVQIYDTVQGNAKHRSMEMGQERNNFSVKLSSGTIVSRTWSSSNERIVTVRESYDGFVIVTAHDEGTAAIKVTVVTEAGETLSDTCTISVYTKRTKTAAQLKTESDFFRAASVQSVVRRRGEAGQGFTIVASCGSFYRVVLPDNYQFEDDLTHQYAYVQKSAVYVPVTEVKLNLSRLQLEKKSYKKVSASVLPLLADNKEVVWKSSNKKVAVVSSKGKITAKGYGTAVITVKTKDGGKTDTCKVTVKKKVKKSKKSGKKSIRAVNLNPNGKYIFRFDNSDRSFGGDTNYYLTKKDKKKLIDGLYRGKYEGKSRKAITSNIEQDIDDHWEGSCYGMSAVTALNKGKKINGRKYCKSKRGQPYTLRYLDLPKDNKLVMSLINYYQLAQFFTEKISMDCNKKNCKRMIKNAKKKKLQLFGFMYREDGDEEESGHEILLKEYIKTKKGYAWISTYDPNSPHRKTYIKVNMKTGKVKSEDYENMFDCVFIYDFSIFDAIKIDRG